MNDEFKNFLLWSFIVLVLFLALTASFGSGYAYRDREARRQNNDVRATIQQLKGSIRGLDAQLRTTREELERGQSANTEAQGTVEDLSRRNEQSQFLIDNSRQRLSDIERQLADIDQSNGIASTDK